METVLVGERLGGGGRNLNMIIQNLSVTSVQLVNNIHFYDSLGALIAVERDCLNCKFASRRKWKFNYFASLHT